MSKIKNGASDQYGPETFEQQKFGIAGVEGVKSQHFQSTPISKKPSTAKLSTNHTATHRQHEKV